MEAISCPDSYPAPAWIGIGGPHSVVIVSIVCRYTECQAESKLCESHGQGSHLTLLRTQSHMNLLDAYGSLNRESSQLANEVSRLIEIRNELAQHRTNERDLIQRKDLLAYQIAEITAASLDLGEEKDLRDERVRLANAETLIQHSAAALRVLEDSIENGSSVSDLLGQGLHAVNQLVGLDPSLKGVLDQLNNLNYQLVDITAELLSYQDKLEFNPSRQSYLEERLDLIGRLKRKYGDSVEDVLAWSENAALELEGIERGDYLLIELADLEEKYLHKVGSLSEELSIQRKDAATRLSDAIEGELSELSMEQARFSVGFSWTEDSDGVYVNDQRLAFDRSGIDTIEFLVSANPGESLRPIARVASGGETSRLMLALKSVLAQVDQTPTLIFDEIDQGIGGRIGDVVGQMLWDLTRSDLHQVIVVTHLPQLAGYADGHFHVSKELTDSRTITRVNILDQGGRVQELASMLGTQGQSATGGAESILKRVEEVKTLTTLS